MSILGRVDMRNSLYYLSGLLRKFWVLGKEEEERSKYKYIELYIDYCRKFCFKIKFFLMFYEKIFVMFFFYFIILYYVIIIIL